MHTALGVVLNTRFPVTLLWGPEFVLVYNEAYVEMIAGKHPGALGRPTREVFPEAWDVIGPMLHGVRDGGGPNWQEPVTLYRFHIEDPVVFKRSIRVTIERGHANRRDDEVSSTAFWYQAEPHKPFPPLPAADDRLPSFRAPFEERG